MTTEPSTLIDSNVLLDLISQDPRWANWSARALAEAFDTGPVVINPIVYAEVSMGFNTLEELEDALPSSQYLREPLPFKAGFLAGKAFLSYRRRGGTRQAPLPDFYIGAHAAVAGHRLLTRDARRYRTYFAGIDIIAPT